jgi:hypothetical protein
MSQLEVKLQPSKENIQNFKTIPFSLFPFSWVFFVHLDPNADPAASRNQCGSMWIWMQIHNTGSIVTGKNTEAELKINLLYTVDMTLNYYMTLNYSRTF